MRILLAMSLARNWGVTLCKVSAAFLHALVSEDIFVWLPSEFYPTGHCLWKLKRAMCGLKQSQRLRQEHFTDVRREMKCQRCKSDPNLYAHESGELYILAYVDDPMIIGSK